jgi:ABC-2 type transport system ATP-binding protein
MAARNARGPRLSWHSWCASSRVADITTAALARPRPRGLAPSKDPAGVTARALELLLPRTDRQHIIPRRCAGFPGVSRILAGGLPRTLLIMSQAATAGIEVEGLVREFKNGPRAVDGIELEVAPGEIYGFLGPNGAGKSTTVLMLTTLLPPTAGTARVSGHDIIREGAAVRASIGAALQEAALDPLLTGRDHMRLQTTLQGLPKAKRRVRGDELIERVGLTDAADRKVGGYSGGMKRRLDLALALVHSPRVLFLDEPTTGLDPSSRADLWAEVARLARDDGVTVFLTTQYLEEADVLADRVGIIDRGQIVAEGTPETLKAEIGRPSVEAVPADRSDRDAVAGVLRRFGAVVPSPPGHAAVRLDSGEDLVAVVRALDSADVRVADLQLHQPSLDDVFLAKTGRKLDVDETPEEVAA